MGQVSTWIVGPAKGVLTTAQNGNLPPFFQKVNKNGIPTSLLIIQASLVSVFALLFLLVPSINSSYWMLLDLTILLYLIMYVLMFLAAICLRYTKPDVPRTYRVPGGNAGMWTVVGLGVLTSLFTMSVGFFPPAQLPAGNIAFYETFLNLGILIAVSIPLIIYQFRKPGWVAKPPITQSEQSS